MKMLTAIKLQFLLMVHKRNFRFIFTFLLCFSLCSYMLNLYVNRNTDISQMYSSHFLYLGTNGSNLWPTFSFLFPFIVVFPFSFSYMEDTELMNFPYFLRRFGRKRYFISKYMSAFIGGAIVIGIPFLVNLILCYITFPLNENTAYGTIYYSQMLENNVIRKTIQGGKPFLSLFQFSPIVYSIFYLLLLSMFSGFMSVFSLSCSFFVKKYKILIFIPNFIIFYLSPILNGMVYSNENLTYINLNLLDYFSTDSFYGLSIMVILIFISVILLFSVFSYRYICVKEEI